MALASNMMKKKYKLIVALVCLGLSVYFLPIFYSHIFTKRLDGYFDSKSMCLCGHEEFLRVDEDVAYIYRPGHGHKKKYGRVERSGNMITFFYSDAEDTVSSWLEYRNGSYFYKSAKNPSSESKLDKVKNPWRTWLPLYWN